MEKITKNILRETGLKATPARKAILDIFTKSKVPLSAEDISAKLHNKKINEATVYRTLSLWTKKGILKEVNLRKDFLCFELADGHHHHIVCTNCDKVEDFENKEIEKILGRIVEKSSKFKNINEHSLELFGFCRECA